MITVCARCGHAPAPLDTSCRTCGLALTEPGALVALQTSSGPGDSGAGASPAFGTPLEGPYAVENRPPGGWCPQCSRHLQRFQPRCPGCGASMVLADAGREYVGDVPDFRSSDFLTPSATADFALGVILGIASVGAGGIGVIAIPVAIVALRNRYGQLCRGLLLGGVVTGILMLAYWWFFGAGLHVKI